MLTEAEKLGQATAESYKHLGMRTGNWAPERSRERLSKIAGTQRRRSRSSGHRSIAFRRGVALDFGRCRSLKRLQ